MYIPIQPLIQLPPQTIYPPPPNQTLSYISAGLFCVPFFRPMRIHLLQGCTQQRKASVKSRWVHRSCPHLRSSCTHLLAAARFVTINEALHVCEHTNSRLQSVSHSSHRNCCTSGTSSSRRCCCNNAAFIV